MLRLIYVVIMRIGSILHFVPKMKKYARNPQTYSEEDCHELAKVMIRKVAKTARITTSVHGIEHLPTEDGFGLFSNHQSKFDALGIMEALPRPCRVLMDMKRSKMPLANEYVALVRGKRLNREDIRQQVTCFREITREMQEGKTYLIFPEAGYAKGQTNVMGTFHSGCFRSAMRSGHPIVPVALVDFWKTFGRNSLKKVHTDIYFLPPITAEEYAHMSTADISIRVQSAIAEKIKEVTGEEVWSAEKNIRPKI